MTATALTKLDEARETDPPLGVTLSAVTQDGEQKMALSNNATIEIRQVANGYVVMPSNAEDRIRSVSDDDRHVFQTFSELQAWLMRHFTHREKQVAVDGA